MCIDNHNKKICKIQQSNSCHFFHIIPFRKFIEISAFANQKILWKQSKMLLLFIINQCIIIPFMYTLLSLHSIEIFVYNFTKNRWIYTIPLYIQQTGQIYFLRKSIHFIVYACMPIQQKKSHSVH